MAPPPPKPSPSVPPKLVPSQQEAGPARAVRGQLEVTTDSGRLKLSPEARALLEQQAKVMAEVRAFAKDHPEEAGKLLRVWLSKGKGE